MSDAIAWGPVAAVLAALFVLIGGGVWGASMEDGKCERGEPIVIKAKVYRCVEQKP